MSEPWTPHEYQLRSVKHLLERGGAALFLDPGMGKTSSVLAALKVIKTQGVGEGSTLVLAPLRVAQNVWPGEVAKWADFNDLSIITLHGPDKDRLLRTPADIYVLNYEGLDWFLTAHGIERTGATRLIVDESTRLKNSQSKRFKALRKHLNAFTKRWILTGTPSANGLEDLWAQIFLLDGGAALGRYITHFRMQYFIPPMPGGFKWEPRPGAAEEIYEKIKPLCLRLAAEDYLELPELVNVNVMVDLPPAARRTYEDIYNHFITDLASGVVTAANAAVAGNKCLQICNGALYSPAPDYTILHDAKLDALMDLLEELNGAPALIFYQYDHDLARIQQRLQGRGAWLGGATTAARLQALVNGFNAGAVPELLAHPASAGHGLNLQGTSNHVIWFGLPWSLELYDQALKRVWRQGNPNTHVFIHHILANDTMDMKVLRVLHGKDKSQRALFAALTS
jgi:SNF2 family DNA or RNA helicase